MAKRILASARTVNNVGDWDSFPDLNLDAKASCLVFSSEGRHAEHDSVPPSSGR